MRFVCLFACLLVCLGLVMVERVSISGSGLLRDVYDNIIISLGISYYDNNIMMLCYAGT